MRRHRRCRVRSPRDICAGRAPELPSDVSPLPNRLPARISPSCGLLEKSTRIGPGLTPGFSKLCAIPSGHAGTWLNIRKLDEIGPVSRAGPRLPPPLEEKVFPSRPEALPIHRISTRERRGPPPASPPGVWAGASSIRLDSAPEAHRPDLPGEWTGSDLAGNQPPLALAPLPLVLALEAGAPPSQRKIVLSHEAQGESQGAVPQALDPEQSDALRPGEADMSPVQRVGERRIIVRVGAHAGKEPT